MQYTPRNLGTKKTSPTSFVLFVFRLSPSQERDQVRRFITLIDALYESHAKVVCTAALDPISLCPGSANGNGAWNGAQKIPHRFI